ncbi:glycoside hydrolase family 13 [Candidatus Sumerlaeota bacterium]|nr:glycoside hydrolase family 13 [Candidatus Sumerlaeota bacterium]
MTIAFSHRKQKNGTHLSCYAPGAEEVCIAGDFNEWDPADHPMNHGTDGIWSVDLKLPSGRHEYKFVVDGKWACGEPGCNDHNTECNKCVPNPYGTMNHVVEVA